MSFKFYELNYSKNPINNGEYIDLSKNLLDIENNLIFEEDSIPCGFYIKDIELILDDDFFKFISSIKEYSTNRGDISGVIQLNRLEEKQKERIEKGIITKFNKNNTRTKRTELYKFEFCNMIFSFIFNETNKRSIKYKKEIDKSIKPIIKKVHKIMKSHIQLPKEKNYFDTIFTDIIVNKATRSAIHTDSNNALEYSCLIQFSNNKKLISSNLNLPDYNISIPLYSNKSLLCLPLSKMRHSNDPIEKDLLNSRISLVFYNRTKKYSIDK